MRQKQPLLENILLESVLPPDFPVNCGLDFIQSDKAILFLHKHNYLELGFCHSGSGVFVVEDKILPYTTGDVVIITSKEIHLAQSRKGTTSRWTWVNVDPVAICAGISGIDVSGIQNLRGSGFYNILEPASRDLVSGMLVQVIGEFRNKAGPNRIVVKHLLIALLACLAGLSNTVPVPEQKPGRNRLFPALEYIGNNYHQEISVGVLARACFMSLTHFRRKFRASMAISPSQYIHSVRVKMACVELGSSSKSISEIASDCGYPTISSFNRKFRDITGTSPAQWRKRQA